MEKIERFLRAYQSGVVQGAGKCVEFLDDRLPTPVVIFIFAAIASVVGYFSPPWLRIVLVIGVVVPWLAFLLEMFLTMLACEALSRKRERG